jgi:NAD(P)-dependent dehydrogenase (short-subunit alcohol dehydrogenase family)
MLGRFSTWRRGRSARRFDGEVVVVTGAGSGIGEAAARAYAAEGARVHVVDVERARALAVAGSIGESAQAHAVNCADSEAMAALAKRVGEQHGQVNVLQSGVGTLVTAPVDRMTLEEWQRLVNVNLWSAIHGLRHFLPWIDKASGHRHLVNIASVAGLVGFPYNAGYCATKFALVGLSQALAYELAPRAIGVTAVCPGMVRSRLVADGRLELPDPWPEVFDWAYENLAAPPEAIARATLDAVHQARPLVVPSAFLGQLWRMERYGGDGFRWGAAWLSRGIHRIGRRVTAR